MLAAGSTVLVQPIAFEQLRPGDLITWDEGASWNTHRIIAIGAAGCMTKGDANWEPDRKVLPEQILGRVVRVEEAGAAWDLTRFPWSRLNPWIGRLSRLEFRLAKIGRAHV